MVLFKSDFCGVNLRSAAAEYQDIPLQFVGRQLGGYFPAEYNCGVVSAE